MLSALLIHGVPIECIHQASIRYRVPPKIIISVIETENGSNGLAKPNKNGTFDYGIMQINSVWVNQLQSYGYTAKVLQYDACANVNVGTWILSQHLNETKNLWLGIGNYHSYTQKFNQSYQVSVSKNFQKVDSITSKLT